MSRSSNLATSERTATCCPVCGAPAEMSQEPDGEMFARCAIINCPAAEKWLPLAEWNSDRLAVSEIPPARVLFEQSRARLAVIAKEGDPVWGELRREVQELAPAAQALVVTSVDQVDLMREAREKRLSLRAIRLSAEHQHKALKRDIIDRGNAIDAAKREIVDVVAPLEQHLLEQEEFEKRAVAAETEVRQLEREEILRGFVENPELMQLAAMSKTDFLALRDFHEARFYAQQDADRKAAAEEAARVKREADEREAQRAEVERLRAEAAENERALQFERAEAAQERQKQAAKAAESEWARKAAEAEHERTLAAERAAYARDLKAAEDKACAEREAIEKKAREEAAAERERQRKELEAAAIEREQVAAVARAEQARLQAIADAAALEARTIREAKQAADAEIVRQRQVEQAAADTAAKAPDREKLCAFADALVSLFINTPIMATAGAESAMSELETKVTELAAWVRSRAESL